jgi:hypothetical protein
MRNFSIKFVISKKNVFDVIATILRKTFFSKKKLMRNRERLGENKERLGMGKEMRKTESVKGRKKGGERGRI